MFLVSLVILFYIVPVLFVFFRLVLHLPLPLPPEGGGRGGRFASVFQLPSSNFPLPNSDFHLY
jgi:hypothetical protein